MKKKSPVVVEKSPSYSVYETEIEYTCPVRGKVKQKVKVKRIDAVDTAAAVSEILPSKSITEKLDKKYSGLDLSDYSLDEEHNEDIL